MLLELSEEKLNEIASNYERDGFALIRNLLSQEDMAPIIAQWQRLRDPLREGKIVDGLRRDNLYIHGMLPPPLGNLIRHPAIVAIAKKLLGPDVALYFNRLNVKDQRYPNISTLHQDMPYFHGGDKKINFFIALQDTNINNGAMTFVPGSHRLGMLDLNMIDISKHPEFEVLVPSLRPGDLVIANIYLWHSSVLWYSETTHNNDRALLQMIFQPADDGSWYPPSIPEPTLIAGKWLTNEFPPWVSPLTGEAMTAPNVVSFRSKIIRKAKAAVPLPVKKQIKRVLSSAKKLYN